MQDKRRGYHQLTDPEGESAGYRKPDHGNGEGKWETGENQRLKTAEAKRVSHGVEKENVCDIPSQYRFFPYYFGFLITVGLCFWRPGGLGWGGSVLYFYTPCILGTFEGSWCSSLEEGNFLFLFSSLFRAAYVILSARACWWGLPRHVH